MRIIDCTDKTMRVITLNLSDAEIVKDPFTQKTFQVERVDITVSYEDFTVNVSGPLLLESGELSDFRVGSSYWYGADQFYKTAPGWLSDLVANQGVSE